MNSLRSESLASVEQIIKSAPADISRLLSTRATLFPHASLSTASTLFTTYAAVNDGSNTGNPAVSAALSNVRDELSGAIGNLQTIERWIALGTPQMEDGNNFGVQIQMIVAKYLKETREELTKTMATFPEYYNVRAGAFEKIPSVPTKSSTSSTSKSESTGGKDGAESKESTTTSTETKQSALSSSDRIAHLIAIDVSYYFQFKNALTTLIDAYAVVIDNVEKNFGKLKAPKGTIGNSMSMY